MEEALFALLTGAPEIAAIAGDRVYPELIPQRAQDPLVVYYRIGGAPGYRMAGPDGLLNGQFQVDCRARSHPEALALGRAVHKRLSGYRGPAGGRSIGGIFIRNERHDADKPGAEEFFRVSIDIDVWAT